MELLDSIRTDFVSPIVGVYFLMLFTLIAFLSYNYRGYSKNILLANINSKVLNDQNRDESNLTRKANFWFNCFFLATVTALLFSGFKFYGNFFSNYSDGILLLISFIAVVVGFVFKLVSLKFLGFVFKKGDLTDLYIANVSIKDKAFGLLLFPLLILYNFSIPLQEFSIYSIILISCIYLVLRWVSGVLIGIKQGNLPYFYSILYICTLEILPMVILGKIISKPILSSLA